MSDNPNSIDTLTKLLALGPFGFIATVQPYIIVKKVWGEELWLINNEKYCAKILILNPGFACSQHLHRVKDETFIVLDGLVQLERDHDIHQGEGGILAANPFDKTEQLKAGQSRRIRPFKSHRFRAVGSAQAIVLEISTTHDEQDVVRIQESGKVNEDGSVGTR